ncbi:inositol monophosphatase family protein [Paramicrobacterium agarici]|uniref:Inositol-1-monophosphatase n=1 Tax=Paramicrobacterium agarici TaxID=630514 RepID=A0A2A9DRJ4_9MICO|nr:inositol monophosphatase family protein [Microbacterium agarici]PFG29214.1 myo-inositol-1(or 4)-monophosphatase [Microbacterium agarici]
MSTRELQDLARDVAAKAGELVRSRRREGVSVAATKSSPEDIVTAADRESERLIRGLLLDARPHDSILGEEGGSTSGTSGVTWVVDPIDGTVNYLYGLADYAVSIGVVEGEADPVSWEPLAGAVYAPELDVMYSAARGEGALKGTASIRVNSPVDPGLALVGTGFGYDPERRTRQANVVMGLIAEVRDIRRMGSAAVDLCRVADGQLDGFFEVGLNPWDMAAGALIAREAGARVGGLRGEAATASMTLLAEPGLFAFLEARLEGLNADRILR